LLARVERVVRLTPTIVDVIVRAPAAARHFHPGQFYRLQNFERRSPHVHTDGPRRGDADGRHRADRRLGRS
jgi:NAD(P)H-flavin reductase